jgi:hypothetical protein
MPTGDRQRQPGKQNREAADLSLLGLMGKLVRGFVRNIPMMFVWMLVRTVLAFLVVYVLHAWMVVVNNGGFVPDIARPVYHYIAFAHQRGETVLFWSLSAYVLSALFSRLVFGGGMQVFKDLARVPGYTIRTMSRTGRGTFPLLFLAVALAQLPALLLKNPSLICVLPIALLFSYSMQGRGLAHLMLSCAGTIYGVFESAPRVIRRNRWRFWCLDC